MTEFRDDTVSVIDTTTNRVVGNPIPVGDGPSGIAYDPINKKMYTTSGEAETVNTVSVINLC